MLQFNCLLMPIPLPVPVPVPGYSRRGCCSQGGSLPLSHSLAELRSTEVFVPAVPVPVDLSPNSPPSPGPFWIRDAPGGSLL